MSEKVLRDPVHGDISIQKNTELALLDSPELQRLRGIKQLGTANLVYPCALHTRFDHSLGTLFVTDKIVTTMERQTGSSFFSKEEKELLRIGALLHDVSHIPFGHTFEDERQIFERHDAPDRFAHFLNNGFLAKKIREMGLAVELSALLNGKHENKVMSEIIRGTICADLMDYLARDSYFCGISHTYDQRIIRYFRVDQGNFYIDSQKKGILRQDVLSEVVNLLRLRYFMSERVYFHHAKVASGAMISKAVELAVKNGLTKKEIFPLNDEGLLFMLTSKYSEIKEITELIELLRKRSLYKRCYIITRKIGAMRQEELISKYHIDSKKREEAENVLAKMLRLKPGELIIYCPSSDMALKEANVLVKIDESSPKKLASLKIPEIDVLLDKHRDLWKFYIFIAPHLQDKFKQISKTCEEFFGEKNHMPALQSGQSFFGF